MTSSFPRIAVFRTDRVATELLQSDQLLLVTALIV